MKKILGLQAPMELTSPSKPKDDKRDEEEKLENQKKKKDSKALSSKAKGKEKEKKGFIQEDCYEGKSFCNKR